MFIFNLSRALELRGVSNKSTFLVNLGMAYTTANNFLRGDAVQVRFDQLEQICLALNCTPNDLFEWRPDKDAPPVAETHSLNKLKKTQAGDLTALLKDVPLEKFDEIAAMLQNLKKD